MVFALVAVACFAAAAAAVSAWKRWNERQAYVKESFQSVPATVVATIVEEHQQVSRPTIYQPRITYRYTVQGKDYTASYRMVTSTVLGRGSGTREGSSQIAAQYPPGRQLRVGYNPRNPRDVILNLPDQVETRELGIFWLIAAALISVLGLGASRGALRRFRDPDPAALQTSAGQPTTRGGEPVSPPSRPAPEGHKGTPLDGHTSLISETTIHGRGAVTLGSVFMVFGLLVVAAVQVGPPEEGKVPRPLVLLVVALFPLAGAWVLRHGLRGLARERRIAALQAGQPHAPWAWDYAWDPHEASDLSGREGTQAIAFGIVAAIFLVVFNWIAFVAQPDPLWRLLVGVFDVAVIAAFAKGGFVLLRRAKYRDARLRFTTYPFFLGRELVVDLLGAPHQCNRLTATLRCIKEAYEFRGRTSVVVCYQCYVDTQRIAGPLGPDAPRFRFPLPLGDYETRLRDRPPRYWELEVAAETPGIDFQTRFLVPVYSAPGAR